MFRHVSLRDCVGQRPDSAQLGQWLRVSDSTTRHVVRCPPLGDLPGPQGAHPRSVRTFSRRQFLWRPTACCLWPCSDVYIGICTSENYKADFILPTFGYCIDRLGKVRYFAGVPAFHQRACAPDACSCNRRGCSPLKTFRVTSHSARETSCTSASIATVASSPSERKAVPSRSPLPICLTKHGQHLLCAAGHCLGCYLFLPLVACSPATRFACASMYSTDDTLSIISPLGAEVPGPSDGGYLAYAAATPSTTVLPDWPLQWFARGNTVLRRSVHKLGVGGTYRAGALHPSDTPGPLVAGVWTA